MKFKLKSITGVTLLVVGSAVGAALLVAGSAANFSSRAIAQEAQPNVAQQAQPNKDNADILRARAVVRGAPGSGIKGTVFFSERSGNNPEPGVDITAIISGRVDTLRPGNHGIHIHENGTCQPDFAAAGGHFDPGPFGNSTPVDQNHPFHHGDIPNLSVSQIIDDTIGGLNQKSSQNTLGVLSHQSSRITLSPGPLSVFDENGSAVIVHLNEDRGQPGVTGASGGTRIACGVIELITGAQAEAEEAKIKEQMREAVKSRDSRHN